MIIAEKILFNVIAFFLFIFIFIRMVYKNDTNYLIIIGMQAVGITINFVEIITATYGLLWLKLIMYILCVVIPIMVLLFEKRGNNFSEWLSIAKAKFYIAVKDNKDAKDILINLVTKYPESYQGHKLLAQIYEKEGGMRKAIDEYVKAIDLNKKDYNSYYKVSELLMDLGKIDESQTMLENLLHKKPDYYEASNLLGELLLKEGKAKDAILVYTDALRYRSNDYDLYYSLGIAYTQLNDFANAKMCYEKAAEINHELYGARYNLGQISLLYRDIDKAEEYFTECLYSEELEPKAYFELAKIYMLKREKEKAITFINKAIELDRGLKKKAEEEPLFIPIRMYIVVPKELPATIQEEKEKKKKLSKKEKMAIEHLEKIGGVVENLNLKDLGKATELKRKLIENEKELENNM